MRPIRTKLPRALALLLAVFLALTAAASAARSVTLADLDAMKDTDTLTKAEILPLLAAVRAEAYEEGYRDALVRGGDLDASDGLRAIPDAGGEDYVLNAHTLKFHHPDCRAVPQIAEENRKDFTGTREEVINMGYDPCGICKP